jgi:hypothetical protein
MPRRCHRALKGIGALRWGENVARETVLQKHCGKSQAQARRESASPDAVWQDAQGSPRCKPGESVRQERLGEPRVGPDCCGVVRQEAHGGKWLGRNGSVRKEAARHERQEQDGTVRCGTARGGSAWRGRVDRLVSGALWRGEAGRRGRARRGRERRGRKGEVGYGAARPDRQERVAVAWSGAARQERQCSEWQDTLGAAWNGWERHAGGCNVKLGGALKRRRGIFGPRP